MKILITAGGTQEKIDQVRSITNTSTGKTALDIAQHLHNQGYREILYVHAAKAEKMPGALQNFSFVSSEDLENQLKDILRSQDIDVIIHAAAVSDFVVDKVVINGELFEPEKISKLSSQDEVELVLRKRSKIIESLKGYSRRPHPLVVGFKLTNTLEDTEQKDQTLKLSMSENVDFVVHNDLHTITADQHISQIYFKESLMFQGKTKNDLCKNIQRILELYTFNKSNEESNNGLMS